MGKSEFLKSIIQTVVYKLCLIIVYFNLHGYFTRISIINETCSSIISQNEPLKKFRFLDYYRFPVVMDYAVDDQRDHRVNYEKGINKIVDYVKEGTRSENFIIHEYFPDDLLISMKVNEGSLAVIRMDIVQPKIKIIKHHFLVVSGECFRDLTTQLGISNRDYFYHKEYDHVYINADFTKAMKSTHFVLPNNIKWYLENAKNVDQALKIFESKFVTITNAIRYHSVKNYVLELMEKHSNMDNQVFIFDRFLLTHLGWKEFSEKSSDEIAIGFKE